MRECPAQSERDHEACVCYLTEPWGRPNLRCRIHLGVPLDAGLIEREQRASWALFLTELRLISSIGDIESLPGMVGSGIASGAAESSVRQAQTRSPLSHRSQHAGRNQLLDRDEPGDHSHPDDAHDSEREERRHQRPATADTPSPVPCAHLESSRRPAPGAEQESGGLRHFRDTRPSAASVRRWQRRSRSLPAIQRPPRSQASRSPGMRSAAVATARRARRCSSRQRGTRT